MPAIALSDVVIPTPFKSIPMQGDQLTFDNLTINFIVDEFLENYLSLHEWMTGIGFPKSRKQFSDFKTNISNTPTTRTFLVQVVILEMFKKHPQIMHYSLMQLLPYCQIKTILL